MAYGCATWSYFPKHVGNSYKDYIIPAPQPGKRCERNVISDRLSKIIAYLHRQ